MKHFYSPLRLLIDSKIANCIPKQIPKNGIFNFFEIFIALILPTVPSFPKPPGTSIPSQFFISSHLEIFSIFFESTHLISTLYY